MNKVTNNDYKSKFKLVYANCKLRVGCSQLICGVYIIFSSKLLLAVYKMVR